MQVKETARFRRRVKRFHPNEKADLDQAVRDIQANPLLGEQKRGDLAWVRVCKFRLVGQLALLAYELRQDEGVIVLHAVGSHENFYRDLAAAAWSTSRSGVTTRSTWMPSGPNVSPTPRPPATSAAASPRPTSSG